MILCPFGDLFLIADLNIACVDVPALPTMGEATKAFAEGTDRMKGLPKTHHTISVFTSVMIGSMVAQMIGGITDASSMIMTMRLPWLCKPAKASGLCSFQGRRSTRHVCSCAGSALISAVAVSSKKVRPRNSRYHFRSSARLRVDRLRFVGCGQMPLQSRQVAMLQSKIQQVSAVLPTP